MENLSHFEQIASHFNCKGGLVSCIVQNNGHINSTYLLEFMDEAGVKTQYILQKINTFVFKKPDQLMSNISGVTEHLRKKIAASDGNPDKETLTFIKCNSGKFFYRDDDGNCWRCYRYIDDVFTYNTIENKEVFRNAGKAFGNFQKLLADFPISKLYDTIPDFHNTYVRFLAFKKAVSDNLAGRADSVADEINFVLARESDTKVFLDMIEKDELPIRVTHNDTKLNNILFDSKTNEGICVIDLDTVMPGLSLYDFGDSIRFGANTASEDEKDVSKVSLDLELYKAYVEGYLSTAKDSLTKNEIDCLPFSAKLMTFECGMRFLTDYLNGDTYFKTEYPEHNLVRCHTQFALVSDMEKKMDEMKKITALAEQE